MTAGAGLHMLQAPALRPGARERGRARSSVSSSHISLPLDPCTSFPRFPARSCSNAATPLPANWGEKPSHILFWRKLILCSTEY